MTNVEPSPEGRPAATVDEIVGENVHRLMWRARESQTAVAELLGMTQGALSHKLRGRRPWFASEIDFMADRYSVTHSQLFEQTPEPQPLDYRSEASVTELLEWSAARAEARAFSKINA